MIDEELVNHNYNQFTSKYEYKVHKLTKEKDGEFIIPAHYIVCLDGVVYLSAVYFFIISMV